MSLGAMAMQEQDNQITHRKLMKQISKRFLRKQKYKAQTKLYNAIYKQERYKE